MKIRLKLRKPFLYGGSCWIGWREWEVKPEQVSITIGRPSSLCQGLSDRYGGVQVHLPEQERIWIRFERGGEYEIEDFATPDMGDETYLSLYRRNDGRCDDDNQD